MDVIGIPFNRFVGIQHSDRAESLLMLKQSPDYGNHLGTVHASAQFALGEATSGAFLLQRFAEQSASVAPVVRRCEVKYSRPAHGPLYAVASLDGDHAQVVAQLEKRGRAVVRVGVRVQDASGETTMAASFEWFIASLPERTQ